MISALREEIGSGFLWAITRADDITVSETVTLEEECGIVLASNYIGVQVG